MSAFVFIAIAELGTATAMRVALRAMDEPACMFGVKTFMSSASDYLRSADILFGEMFKHEHHALAALPGERLAIWSYQQMAFVPYAPGPNVKKPVPSFCDATISVPEAGRSPALA
ncbi:hypothetical protein [Yoonia vestfoldensis]|uniref:hypothetical protein n=1 Tax=Yoonia vestfoldensis TaxID=245188 RepID=UPI000375BEBD|nr:hypothetical protein [Yoonia vestfoldensis]